MGDGNVLLTEVIQYQEKGSLPASRSLDRHFWGVQLPERWSERESGRQLGTLLQERRGSPPGLGTVPHASSSRAETSPSYWQTNRRQCWVDKVDEVVIRG